MIFLFQIFFIQGFLFEYVVPAIRRLRGPIHKYEKMHKKLDADDKWPPVGRYEVASVRGKVSIIIMNDWRESAV